MHRRDPVYTRVASRISIIMDPNLDYNEMSNMKNGCVCEQGGFSLAASLDAYSHTLCFIFALGGFPGWLMGARLGAEPNLFISPIGFA